jgi:sodium-dependent dicarboxylate transporter 2/3/5
MKRWILLFLVTAVLAVLPLAFIDSLMHALTVSIAAVCLFLWITEAVPPFVPTLLLWVLVPILLGRSDPAFSLQRVLSWAADPVIALFFGGFVLGAAAERSGLARKLMGLALRSAADSYRMLLLLVISVTAFLSMWMSNIAAAALVLACLHPVLANLDREDVLRKLLLVGVALAADFGGMATPIGTGPNAIAIASLSEARPISFLAWMSFALPLTVGMVGASYLLLSRRIPRNANTRGIVSAGASPEESSEGIRGMFGRPFILILAGAVLLWLTEPLHGVPASVISLAAAAAVFVLGILKKDDLLKIDWSTLLLIAGGITLGRLLEQTGVIKGLSDNVPFDSFDPTLSLFLLCLATALLSALMSNTATAVLLIPLATALVPHPSTAILIAIAASLGVPLVISTPPNAMVFGEGGVRFGDLFWPGIILMVCGCLLISITGRPVLSLAGID